MTFLNAQVIEIVQGRYDIGTVADVHELQGGTTNRSFRVTVQKQGRRKTFFLRQYKKGITTDEIRFEHALITHTIKKGLTASAAVVANRAGETFVSQESSGSIFAVYEYLQGEDRYAWDRPYLTDTEFENAGRLLADFHHAVSDFDPGALKREEPCISSLWRAYPERFERYGQHERQGRMLPYFRKNLPRILNVIARNPLTPAHTADMPVIGTHYDFHPGNLKWEGEQIVGIFDFDWCKMDLRLFDVCMALIYFSHWKDHRDGELRTEKCRLFVCAYQRRLLKRKGIEPLTAAEADLMPRMLAIANMNLLNWGVADYLDKAAARDEQYLVYLKHNVRLMDWLEANRSKVVRMISQAL